MNDLLGSSDLRRIAAALEVRPSKNLGQNFVVDGNTVRRIAAAAELTPDDVVIEVGPGFGSLTLALLPRVTSLHALEIDGRLATALPATVKARAPELAGRMRVHHVDALRVTASTFDDAPTALVANLPYNVAVPVVLHLLATLPSLRHGLVMVQSEVAQRLTAAPGSRTYGVPSAKLAWYATARRAGTVPRGVFWPVPNVDSGLVAFHRHQSPEGDAGAVFATIDAAFAQRRKTLRSALAGWAGGSARAEAILRAAEVDPRARGEALDIETFARITRERNRR